MTLILYILFLHWLADFVCQSDWMAQNKSKAMWPLVVHIAVYTWILMFGLMSMTGIFEYALLNGLIHLGVDFVTSRINSKLWQAGKVHWFFVSVGLDQLIHTATLLLTMGLLK